MENFMVVLFKDKKKKKILKKFITYKRAKQFYKTLMDKSKEIIFDVKVQSGKECKFELGLVELSSKQLIPVYMTDEFGRNIKVKLDEDGMTLFEISPYKKEELIFDIKENRKITVEIVKGLVYVLMIKGNLTVNNAKALKYVPMIEESKYVGIATGLVYVLTISVNINVNNAKAPLYVPMIN